MIPFEELRNLLQGLLIEVEIIQNRLNLLREEALAAMRLAQNLPQHDRQPDQAVLSSLLEAVVAHTVTLTGLSRAEVETELRRTIMTLSAPSPQGQEALNNMGLNMG